MQTISFNAEDREGLKASVLRKAGKIPAVLYGAGVLEHFTVKSNDVKHLIYTPDFKLGEVAIGGAKHKCIVKEIQYHPMTDEIRHIDFLALKDGHKIKVDIPVKFKGDSPGIKEGGKLMQSMRRVKIKADPIHIVDELFIDISHVKLGEAVRVKDIELNDNLELMVDPAVPVAIVEVPRALKAAQAADEGADPLQDAPAAAAAPEA